MHVCNRTFCKFRLRKQDIRDSFVHHELRVGGHFQLQYLAVAAKDLVQVAFIDVLGELFNDNLCAS